MAIVDGDGVAGEDGVHFLDQRRAAGFDAVVGEHAVDVVSEDFVRVDEVLVFAHGLEVGARGLDYRSGGFNASRGVAEFFAGEGGGDDPGNRLDDGGLSGGFDEFAERGFEG